MTKGEYRVGVTFNPSNNSVVDAIKRAAADLIDLIGGITPSDPFSETDADVMLWAEKGRLISLAQTAIEEGAMWAVKAATKGPMA